ncbi:hypothetical protein [Paraflavitalea speifideaquila]|uniref:hypothetical protein n=1 Tax=Paraflavitalea speifideaquila TaxID=3076558 RepID=UPI0028E6C3AD|nr:hypothetical protein [Paraflavitalea speifideiaquila]
MGYFRRHQRKGSFTLLDGSVVDADQRFAPISVDIYYITPINALNVKGFMKNPNVRPFAL